MTVFINVAQRVAIARKAGLQYFYSLHADSTPDRMAEGAFGLYRIGKSIG